MSDWVEIVQVLTPHVNELTSQPSDALRKRVAEAVVSHSNAVLERVCAQQSATHFHASYAMFSKQLDRLDSPLQYQLDVSLASREFKNDAVLQLENDGSRSLTLQCLSSDTVREWLKYNKALTTDEARQEPFGARRSRYLAFPVFYSGMDGAQSGHMSAMLFDHRAGSVFLVDPNGTSSFFETDLECMQILQGQATSQQLVEQVMQDYCKHLSEMGAGQWHYVSQNEWNPQKISINTEHGASTIGNGHCVVTTLMLLHVLELTQQTPGKVIQKFANANAERLLALIAGYTTHLDDMFCEFGVFCTEI